MQTNIEGTKNSRFLEMWEYVKKENSIDKDSDLLSKLGYNSRSAISIVKSGRPVSDTLVNALCDKYGISRKYIVDGSLPKTNNENNSFQDGKSEGDAIREQKAFGEIEDPGLIYVPIAAQAGYALHFTEPVYINQLKRWKIPDFPYKGDKFRIFQIEGDSMTYIKDDTVMGIQDGMEVVAQRVEPEDWEQTTQWYVHVVVFDDSLVIKRLYREKDNKSFILISDNPSYAQKRISIESIKELWIMKRYLGWNVPPPKQYKIEI